MYQRKRSEAKKRSDTIQQALDEENTAQSRTLSIVFVGKVSWPGKSVSVSIISKLTVS
jgi:hypothetical protein